MERQKPNILLITTDQQRYDTIHDSGFSHMKTPNLDRLAQEGCTFEQAFSPNPTCMAARHNIITGLPARYHGFDDNYFDVIKAPPFDVPTFPQVLADNGYDTAAFGKMHFTPVRRHNGFNHMELMEEIPRYREDDDYAQFLQAHGYGNIQSIHGVRHLLYMLPQRSLVPERFHGSVWVADRTIQYLENNHGNRPFMIWSSFIQPHPPFDVPDQWADMYRDADLPPLKESRTPISPRAQESRCIADYPNEDYLRRARELYCAAISFVDEQVGRILQKLKDIGQLDNTLIVYTSDHGEMMGDYGAFQKFLPYDSSARIPFIVRYPEHFVPGSRSNAFVDLNDLFPTFLDAAGVSYPANIQLPGESLLIQNGKKDRRSQYIEHAKGNRRWISLREERYKYNYYYGGGLEELFDMTDDPDETTNLLYGADIPEKYRDIAAQMRGRLAKLEETYGLPGYVKDGDLICLPSYELRKYRESNFPMFGKKLRENERRLLLDGREEILAAIQKEPVVCISQLDLETFQKKSGYSDAEIQELIEQSKHE